MRKREVVVGAFVFVGMVVTGGVVFMIGNERRAFSPKDEYVATFPDVQGLKPGAPVRLSGVDIGQVKSVSHSPNPQDDKLYVRMEIVRDEAQRIREDSSARIANKGLLGDKMMEITPGTPGRPPLPAGSMISSEEPADYTNLLTRVGSIADKTEAVVTNLEKTTSTFAEEQTRKDLQESLRSVTIILNSVAQGQGYAGKLLNDPAEAQRISNMVTSFDHTADKLNRVLDGMDKVMARVNTGPGLAHSIVYEQDGQKAIQQIGSAAEEVASTLKGVREGNGLARSVVYGGPGQEKLGENLTAASADLRVIMHNVREGKGTVGALLVDPSLYEDVKRVVGNVQRNDVLRALVRYSIKQDEKSPEVRVAPSSEDQAAKAK